MEIYCVLVLSRNAKETGSSVAITDGAVDTTYVKIAMSSGIGEDLAYDIFYFGNHSQRNIINTNKQFERNKNRREF